MEKSIASKSVKPTKTQKQNTVSVPAPIPVRTLSKRKGVIILVWAAVGLMLYPSIKIAFHKQEEVSDAKAAIVKQQEENSFLAKQVARWQDPNYVKQQARSRINMVMPGETAYWVTGEQFEAEAEESAKRESEEDSNWVTRLADSAK